MPVVVLPSLPQLDDVVPLHGLTNTAHWSARRKRDGSQVRLSLLPAGLGCRALLEDLAKLGNSETPHIIHAEPVHTSEAWVLLLRDDVADKNLRILLQGKPLPISVTLAIGQGIAKALAAAHACGVLHGDVRPEVVRVDTPDGEVSVADFGLARVLRTPMENALVGQCTYAAPEVSSGSSRDPDARSDLYSLGVVLFECMTGSPPFSGNDALRLAWAHAATTPPSPVGPRSLVQLVLTLLAKDPDERYQTAEALAADLAHLRRECRAGRSLSVPVPSANAPGRMRISRRIRGREAETDKAVAAFEVVRQSGRPGVLSVFGEPGIGKTSFVEGLRGRLAEHAFARGKLLPTLMDRSHVLRQILGSLGTEILRSGEEELDDWHHRVVRALGPNLGVFASEFPEWQPIVGVPAQDTAALPAAEVRARLLASIVSLFGTIGTSARPLVVLVDDVHWADASHCAWIADLVCSESGANLFVMLCWREQEKTAEIGALFDKLHQRGVAVTALRLGALSEDHVEAFVQASLRCGGDRAREVAAGLGRRARGNPLLLGTLLESAVRGRALVPLEGDWLIGDFDDIALGDEPGVSELLRRRLKSHTAATQAALGTAALLGGLVPLDVLACALGWPLHELTAALWPACDDGLISMRHEVRFVHDTVAEAAEALLDRPAERAAVAWRRLGSHDCAVRRAALALKGGEALTSDERVACRCDLVAAGQQHLATNPTTAERVLRAALEFAPEATDDLRVQATLELAEAQILVTKYDEATALLTELGSDLLAARPMAHARSFELRATAQLARMDFSGAIDLYLQGLDALGVVLPEGIEECLGVSVPDGPTIDTLPIATRQEDLAALRLLGSMVPAMYVSRPALFPFIAATMTKRSVERGVSAWSGFGFAKQALVELLLKRDIEGAYRSGIDALRVFERCPDPRIEARARFVFISFIRHWKEPLSKTADEFEDLLVLSRAAGDVEFVAYDLLNGAYCNMLACDSLPSALRRAQAAAERARHLGWDWTTSMSRLAVQLARNLMGLDPGGFTLEGSWFSEEAEFAQNMRAKVFAFAYFNRVIGAWVRLMAGQSEQALQYLHGATSVADAAQGTPLNAWESFIEAVALADCGRDLEVVETRLAQLEAWARCCPANQAARVSIVRGACAAQRGVPLEALGHYETAMEEARRYAHPHDEATACERAARLAQRQGLVSAARGYAQNAVAAWRTWGALIKAQQIALEFDVPVESATPEGESSAARGALTLEAQHRALAAIAEPSLGPRALLDIAQTVTGAERATLVLDCEGVATVVATRRGEVFHEPRSPLSSTPDVPRGMAALVERTGHTILISDVECDPRYSDDPDLVASKARTVLAVPLGIADVPRGVLVLEHARVPGAFASERVTIVEALVRRFALAEDTRLRADKLRHANAALVAESAARRSLEAGRTELERQVLHAHKLDVLGLLTSTVAHDFNNVLTVVLGCGTLLQEECDDPTEVASHADAIIKAAESAAKLTRQLLSFSRKDAGAPSYVDVGQSLRDLSPVLARLAGPDIHIDISAEGDCGVRFDQGHLHQIVTNFVVNSRDAMTNGGHIRLRIERGSAEEVRLITQDSGPGIAPQVLPHIFEPFFTTKGGQRGVGLGLATVKTLIERAGGTITARNAPEGGALFHVTLAYAPPPPRPGDAVDPGERTLLKILLVESDATLRGLLDRVLTRRGHKVSSCDRLTRTLPPELDLVVTQWLSSDITGVAVAGEVRSRFPSVRVLYLCSGGGTVEVGPGEAVLEMPFSPARLDAALASVMRRATRAADGS